MNMYHHIQLDYTSTYQDTGLEVHRCWSVHQELSQLDRHTQVHKLVGKGLSRHNCHMLEGSQCTHDIPAR